MRLRSLINAPAEYDIAVRRARAIHRKAKENLEERGLETLYLATGLATWKTPGKDWEPAAPVVLRRCELRPLGAAQDDFELSLTDEVEVNPTLVHVLKIDFGVDLEADELLEKVDGLIDEPWEVQAANEWLADRAKAVPGISVRPAMVLANFSYAKLPMVKDLEGAGAQLTEHEIVAAIAGDQAARKAFDGGHEVEGSPIDAIPLADEYVVLDSDASQNYAINAVLAGQNLIIRGPPGTGKSQTIGNLIASLVARGKKVLFVAEKRAAIEAVLKRLTQKSLEGLVLDLHGGGISRRAFGETIHEAIAASRRAPPVDHSEQQTAVERDRRELNEYVDALHRQRAPWGLSAYAGLSELQGLGDLASVQTRFRGTALKRLTGVEIRRLRTDIVRYAELGGMTLSTGNSPWKTAEVTNVEEVESSFGLADELARRTIPGLMQSAHLVMASVGIAMPATADGLSQFVRVWRGASSALETFSPEVFYLDLPSTTASLSPAARSAFARWRARIFSAEYRAARSHLRAVLAPAISPSIGDEQLLEAAEFARAIAEDWKQIGGPGNPIPPANLADLDTRLAEVRDQRSRLEATLNAVFPDETFEGLSRYLEELTSDYGTLVKLPELNSLRESLSVHLSDLLNEMSGVEADPKEIGRGLRFAWLRSVVDHIVLTDKTLGGFVAKRHQRVATEFQEGDRLHIANTPARIRRISAQVATASRDAHVDQAQIVDWQAGLKRRHWPIRRLVQQTSDVLLGLKPCWAMSPLVVSQLLPARTLFDVVIFDEASQVTPADAVMSILRGRQLVVAGDAKQLPPTAFFVSDVIEDEDEELDLGDIALPTTAGPAGFESILDLVESMFQFRTLLWHYRSRDERLIAFSNAYFYDRQLTTFPGIGGGRVLSFVQASATPGDATNSPDAEVAAVVDLVIEHARSHPDESLGVITMGIKHAHRVEEALRHRIGYEGDLNDFFAEDREEPFFVKNLERVQGDERDVIILTVGYGKNARGQLVYRFGPLLTEGGERRLNVAITRAKKRATIVASFAWREMDPEKLRSQGMRLLRQYLEYVDSGGEHLGPEALDLPQLNPFEADVRDTLSRAGLRLVAQHGASGYRIDFAVEDPDQAGRFVLAIECDGASYHSAGSARDRDRLRQEQLERLGWRFHRIWSTEWFRDKEAALQRVLAAYERATTAGAREPSGPEPSVAPAETGELPTVGTRHGPRPDVPRWYSIHEYSASELQAIVNWWESDGLLRTEDELIAELTRDLGFRRRGSNIVWALQTAIRRARSERQNS